MSTDPPLIPLTKLHKAELLPGSVYKPSSPTTARVLSNVNITPRGDDDWHHIVVELAPSDYNYLEGQSLGVIAPGLDERGKPHKVRLYSIASARGGEDGRNATAALSVKRVVYTDPETGNSVRGVASNLLCDAGVGDQLTVTGPAGKTFVLPDRNDVDLLLFATGTGVAPFRAFLNRLYVESNYSGRVTLFYGVRRAADLAYMNDVNGDLQKLIGRPNLRVITALSRENPAGPKVYVQHRLLDDAPEAGRIVEGENCAVYICGIKGMEKGIEESFRQIVENRGGHWDEKKEQLKKEGRWNLEVY